MESVFIYLLVFLIEYILCTIGYKTQKKLYIILGMLFLVLFVGFRYEVGTDYKNYIRVYNEIKNMPLKALSKYEWEIGFKILFKTISCIFKNEKMIFVFIAFLNIYPIFKANELFDYKYLSFSILLFCFLFLPFCMNGMRQGVAMSYILYSTLLLLKGYKKESIINIVLAILFHKSSIIFLPFFIVIYFSNNNYEKTKKRIIYLSFIMSIIILFFLKDIFINLSIENYSSYVNKIKVENVSLRSLILHIPIITIILLSITKDRLAQILKSIMITGYIFTVVGTSAQYVGRIATFFTFFEIMLIPYIVSNIKEKNTKIFIASLLLIYIAIYFIYLYYILGYQEIMPYKNWLFM